MTPGKDQIVIQASAAFKVALGEYATENDLAMAEVIRQAVAQYIGYDISAEPATPRRRQYATDEERKAAALERAKVRREIDKKIREALKNNDMDALAQLRDELAGKVEEDDDS